MSTRTSLEYKVSKMQATADSIATILYTIAQNDAPSKEIENVFIEKVYRCTLDLMAKLQFQEITKISEVIMSNIKENAPVIPTNKKKRDFCNRLESVNDLLLVYTHTDLELKDTLSLLLAGKDYARKRILILDLYKKTESGRSSFSMNDLDNLDSYRQFVKKVEQLKDNDSINKMLEADIIYLFNNQFLDLYSDKDHTYSICHKFYFYKDKIQEIADLEKKLIRKDRKEAIINYPSERFRKVPQRYHGIVVVENKDFEKTEKHLKRAAPPRPRFQR